MFPKTIPPVTSSISQVVSFLFGMLVLFAVLLVAYTSHLTAQVVWVPLIAVVQFVFVLGFTFMVSAVTVFYRDVGIVIGHFMRLLFWISPILWSFAAVAGRGQALEEAMTAAEQDPRAAHGDPLQHPPLQPDRAAPGVVPQGHLRQLRRHHAGRREAGADLDDRHGARPPHAGCHLRLGLVFIIIGTIIFKRLEPAFAKLL